MILRVPWSEPSMGEDELSLVLKVLKSGWLGQGPQVKMLEELFKKRVGAQEAIAVSSGTAALHCALLAAGVKPGDEVIIPNLTFIATINVVLASGAKPVLVDVEPDTFNTSPELVAERITNRTKVIMPIDYAGMPIDIKGFEELAEDYGLILIEDAAEAVGAEYRGRPVGGFNHITCFSFHIAKQMTTIEGGMITTNDAKYAERCRLVRNHGMAERYEHIFIGFNYRMTDLNAAIGIAQLKKLDSFLEHRSRIAAKYMSELKDLARFQHVPPFVTKHPWMFFPILVENRDKLREHLARRGIDTRVCWKPVHMQPYHRRFFKGEKYPNAEEIYRHVICIPIGNGISMDQVEYVITCIKEVLP